MYGIIGMDTSPVIIISFIMFYTTFYTVHVWHIPYAYSIYHTHMVQLFIPYVYGITHKRMVIPYAYDNVAQLKLLQLSHYRGLKEGKAC